MILIKSHFPLKLFLSYKTSFFNTEKVCIKFHLLQYFFIVILNNTVFAFLSQNLSSMVKFNKCFAMHPDDQNPYGDFSILNSLGITPSASHITLYHIFIYYELI